MRRLASTALIVRKRGAIASACALLLCFAACGDDAPAMQPPTDAGDPNRAAAQPATATRPDASSVSLPPPAPPLQCGPTECTPPKNIAADLLKSVTGLPMTGADTVACCLDEQAGVCSSAASPGAACDVVAVSDNRCPGVDLSALADLVGGLVDSTRDAMIGCCTHDACGLDGQIFGRGCVENAEAKRMLSAVPVIGPLIMVPPPRACAEGGPSPTTPEDTDAGT
jgi:hypothetical protein